MSSHTDYERFKGRFAMLLGAAVLTGCAGASVAPGYNAQPAANNRPSTIYVYPFAANSSDVTLNQGLLQKSYRQLTDSDQNQSQLDLAHQTASVLADSIVQQLESIGFTASRVSRGAQVSGDNILVVDGRFLAINEGNRLRRMVVGLGAGEATLDTQVQVYQIANGANQQQIMEFNVNANSGQMPGAAFTAPAGAAAGGAAAAASLGANLAAGAGKTYTSSTGVMAQRSAKQTVAYMSQYFATQGWIPQTIVQAADTNSSATPGLPAF